MRIIDKIFGRNKIKGFMYDGDLDQKRLDALRKFCEDNELNLVDLSLLDMALTHSSYANEKGIQAADYERLEFLGDSVIGFTVVEYLFNEYPEMSEGEMTRIKSDVVSQTSLSEVAKHLSLSRLLNLGKGEVLSRGRRKPSILSDVFESVVGAVYLSSDLEQVKKFIIKQLNPHIIEIVKSGNVDNFKSLLQKEALRLFSVNPTYKVLDKSGPSHNAKFSVVVIISKKQYGKGRGRTKKEAEMEAARKTLETLKS